MVASVITPPARSLSLNSNVLQKIKSYFFTEDVNFNLQFTKFVVCATLLVFAGYPPKLFSTDLLTNFQPIGVFKFLPQLQSAETFNWISTFFRLFLLGAILNFYTRTCLTGAAIFGVYNLIYKYNFGVIYHGNWLICTALLFLVAVPTRAWKPGYRGIHSTWPLRLLQIYTCMVYVSAGLQKFSRSGFSWAWSENLAVRIYSNKLTPVAEFLMNMDPLVLRTVALGVLVAELTSFAALISKKWAYFYLVVWAFMHLGIQLTFSYHMDFLMNIGCFAAFINWSRLRNTKYLSFSPLSIGKAVIGEAPQYSQESAMSAKSQDPI